MANKKEKRRPNRRPGKEKASSRKSFGHPACNSESTGSSLSRSAQAKTDDARNRSKKTGTKPAAGIKPEDPERVARERMGEIRTRQIDLERQNQALLSARHELEASRRKYFDLYEFAPVGYFTFDAKGVIQDVNLAGSNLLGAKKQKLLKKPFILFISSPEDRAHFTAHRKETFLTQQRQECPVKLRRGDGAFFHARLESTAFENVDDQAGHIRTMVSDISRLKEAEDSLKMANKKLEELVRALRNQPATTITLTSAIAEQKRAEKALNENREVLKRMQAFAQIGDWSFNFGTGQVMLSTELFALFGITSGGGSDVQKIIARIVHRADRHKVRKAYRQMVKTSKKEPLELRVVLPDGRDRVIRTEAELVRDSGGKPVSIIGIVQDITERKRAEEELRCLASAIECTADALLVAEPKKGIIRFVNPAFEKLTGYTRNEVVGRDLRLLHSSAHSEMFYQGLMQTLRQEGSWSGSIVSKKKDGASYEEECTYSQVKNADGEVINYISIRRDVTEKKRLESIAQAVATTNNIGYIFAGVSHEIGTPLHTIGIALEMIEKKLDMLPKEKIAEYVGRARTQVSRAQNLLHTLKNFNMYETPESSAIDLSSFQADFLSMIKEDFGKKGISIDVVHEPEAKYVYADPRALQQVLLNVFTNAFDAVERRDSPKIVMRMTASTDRIVRILVTDNGCGIEEARLKDLFKPFYTTKKHGTGLGMVIIKKMLAAMNGTVSVTSRFNEGTTVEICLPSERGGH